MVALGYGIKLAVICEENNKSHKKETTCFTVKPSLNIDSGFGNTTELKLNELGSSGTDKELPITTKAHGYKCKETGSVGNILCFSNPCGLLYLHS